MYIGSQLNKQEKEGQSDFLARCNNTMFKTHILLFLQLHFYSINT